jgi:thiol-disulfide isomerase/thioredoxin
MRDARCLTLGVLALLAGALLLPAQAAAGVKARALLRIEDKLTEDDPNDAVVKTSKSKVHKFKMEQGKAYKIDMTSEEFDTVLRLENPAGKQVAINDDVDPPKNLNSRIIYQASETGEYRIIATAYPGSKPGAYIITVVPASKEEIVLGREQQILGRVQLIRTLPAEEKLEVAGALQKYLAKQGKDLGQKEIGLTFNVAMAIEDQDPAKVEKIYQGFAKVFSASPNDRIAKLGGLLEGAARRIKLPGNTMLVKGKTLDGKEFDWGKYKGKVVLVDYWATWCGPCVAEMPNVKRLYDQYHDRGFEVVGISQDNNDQAPAKFMENKKLPWVCLFDDQKNPDSMGNYYGVFSIPRPILVGRDGRVVSLNARGPELERLLTKLIGPEEKK